jgi:cation:H+ antiporter
MLVAVLAILFGLIVLVWSSDKFVDGAAAIAENFGISKLMVGLTVVAFGTSAPEILVSAISSFGGFPELAVGNALGSNIANIGLVLGITALFVNIPVHRLSATQDLPVYLIVTLITGWVLHDSILNGVDGLLLLSSLAVVVFLIIRYRSKVKDPVILGELVEEAEEFQASNAKALVSFFVGLVLLLLSSRLLVWGAVEIANKLGVDDLIIGLTIVAIGTSLPELAATLTSALKKHHDLAIGNVMGSNILNLLAVLPLPGLISSSEISETIFQRDYMVMVALSLMMTAFIFLPRKSAQITRIKGLALVAAYGFYLFMLVKSTV